MYQKVLVPLDQKEESEASSRGCQTWSHPMATRFS